MNEQTLKSECPECGAEIKVKYWTEKRRVHNGIGMQTVDVDHFREVVEQDCSHGPFYDDEKWNEIEEAMEEPERPQYIPDPEQA